MIYCIEYENGNCRNFAEGRKDLLEWLKLLKDESITDIKKVYRNGEMVSVMDRYVGSIRKEGGR